MTRYISYPTYSIEVDTLRRTPAGSTVRRADGLRVDAQNLTGQTYGQTDGQTDRHKNGAPLHPQTSTRVYNPRTDRRRSYVRTPTYVTYNAEEIIMDALSPYVCTHVRTAPN